MSPHKFELSELSDSQTYLTAESKKQRGVFISPAVGLILVLLFVAIAVGIGIIVHFAGGDRNIVCKCVSASVEKPSAEAIKDGCLDLASQGDPDVCQKCSTVSSTSKSTNEYDLTTQVTTPPGTTEKPKVTDVRLPTSVYPLHYDVTLQTYMHYSDPSNFTFKGFVRILVRCDSVTDNITLHVNVLTVDRSSVHFEPELPTTSAVPQISGFETDTARQFFIVRLNMNMEESKNYILAMNFTSPLKNDLTGLYYSSYTRAGKQVYLATTQFQPTDARKAFPCFDEPAIKATFNITLVRPNDLISISNMPIIANSTFIEDGITYVRDIFQQTPKMSTYLLAFIICDFEYKYNVTKNNILYRAWATPESINQTDYSLLVGVKVIEYYEEYFDVKYPLPKQDMIAIPDFAAGAMENWGLITYRETAMLYKPGVSNEANKESVAYVVSHELAHQWFGNLVTPSWWDDLWLNEGFASYVEYIGMDIIHPEWNVFDQFVINDLQRAFNFDGLVSSHPIYVPVGHPDEINEIFDAISYAKGASIIRMMVHFLGENTFRHGISNYLKNNSYGAAFHDDLWNAMAKQADIDGKGHIDVKSIMDTWALQMNYPVVTVSLHHGNSSMLDVVQERYLSDPGAKELGKFNSPFGYRWSIPLTFTSSINPRFNQNDNDVYWIFANESNKLINVNNSVVLPPNNNSRDWILANVEQHGYYRVNYQVANWKALSTQLRNEHSIIPIINRAQIINDAWNLAKAGHIGLEIALEVIEYLGSERDFVPWNAAQAELSFVDSMLSFTSVYGAFQNLMQDIVNGSFYHYGFSSDKLDHTGVAIQSLIARQACYYGIKSCLDKASELFAQWMTNHSHNPIDPNLKSLVYCYAINNGGQDEWNFALQRYKDADVASEKSNLLSAMACSKQQWILNQYMYIILQDNSPIRKQDALNVVSNVARNKIGRCLAWNFFRGNYDKLKDMFGSSFFSWTRVIGVLTESFNTNFELKEIEYLMTIERNNLGSGDRAFSQALEKVSSNIKWMAKNLPIITKWLKDKKYLKE